MILKRPSIPLTLIGLDILDKRLVVDSAEKAVIREKVRIARAGVNGEKQLENIFKKYTFHSPHSIFHGLNLKSTALFQIDTLFLSQRGAVLLEMKNIRGSIYFPPDQNQIQRTLESGEIHQYECPSVQLQRNMMLLADWFHARNFSVPIYGAVVFPSPQQHFQNIRDQLTLLFPLEVPVYLRKIEDSPPIIDKKELENIANELLLSHQDYNPLPICKTFSINPLHIKKGVLCEKCGTHGMTSISRGWGCKYCGHIDANAHKRAIIEYFILFGGAVTNRACREFLQMDSSDKMTRYLKQMNFPFSGMNKGREYHLELENLESNLELFELRWS